MAAGYLAEPGTQYGPCLEPCEHLDCAATRAEAASPCRICDEPIGYDKAFFNEKGLHLVHAICAYQHMTTVTFQRAWNEYRPECSCGWVGSYWKTETEAEQEALRHPVKETSNG